MRHSISNDDLLSVAREASKTLDVLSDRLRCVVARMSDGDLNVSSEIERLLAGLQIAASFIGVDASRRLH